MPYLSNFRAISTTRVIIGRKLWLWFWAILRYTANAGERAHALYLRIFHFWCCRRPATVSKILDINFNVKEICLILKFKFLTDIRYGKVFFANAATSLCLKPTWVADSIRLTSDSTLITDSMRKRPLSVQWKEIRDFSVALLVFLRLIV